MSGLSTFPGGRGVALPLAVVLVALTVLAASSSRSAVAGTGTVALTRSCPTSGLVVWLDTQGNGGAGSVFYQLNFTNLSGYSCTLFGYPGVSAVDLHGRQLGSAASRNPAHKPVTVTLSDGASASVLLQIGQAENFPAARCRPVTAAGLRVFPPNQTAAKLVPFPFRACSRRGPSFLTVQAVRKT
jgi:hypothetical protein